MLIIGHVRTITYVEQREFTLRIEVRCAFPADYDGEADGYAWWSEVEPATAEIVRAAVAILARQPGAASAPPTAAAPPTKRSPSSSNAGTMIASSAGELCSPEPSQE